jgi:SAM-dependent methyltransferase
MERSAGLYARRRLTELYPDLDRLYDASFNATLAALTVSADDVERMLAYLARLVALPPSARVAVVGCGPQPCMLGHFLARGFDAVGIEPVETFVHAARAYLEAPSRVLQGSAESIPLADASVDLVYCNSVLEHVDSPLRSLGEMARVLRPGGVAWIVTTNRFRLSWRGETHEYAVPFLNWFPPIVRECYAFHHLHYAPWLARYSDRPAVHWFSYAELCRLGRDAGFAWFYAVSDLFTPDDAHLSRRPLRRWLVTRLQRSPWLRALALTLTPLGGVALMVKRPLAAAAAPAAPHVVAG